MTQLIPAPADKAPMKIEIEDRRGGYVVRWRHLGLSLIVVLDHSLELRAAWTLRGEVLRYLEVIEC